MRTSEALSITFDEVPQILKNAGLLYGHDLSQVEIKNTDKVIFWDIQVPNKMASEKETYVVWNVVSVDDDSHADDKVKSREVYAVVDVFTKSRIGSKKIIDLIGSIDEAAVLQGWAFELDSPFMYETDVELYHLSFELVKVMQGGN